MPIRTASAIRAAGAGVAAALTDPLPTLAVAGATYAVGWRVDRAGIQVLSVSLPEQSPTWMRAANAAMATTAWAAANLGVDAALRAVRVPALLRGTVVAGLVYAADAALADQVHRALAARAEAATTAE